MSRPSTGHHPKLLPLLLALPPGALAGVAGGLHATVPAFLADLHAFGPWLRTDPELRHAVGQPPTRLVVDAVAVARPVLEAALPILQQAGTVVVLVTDDWGWLLRWSDRVLRSGRAGLVWCGAAEVRSRRCLEFRADPAPTGREGWVRISLGGAEGPEAILSAARAGGITVRESRIVYEQAAPR